MNNEDGDKHTSVNKFSLPLLYKCCLFFVVVVVVVLLPSYYICPKHCSNSVVHKHDPQCPKS